MSWFVIRTKPKQEWRAKQHLSNQLFDVYLPELVRANQHVEALFPGYLFVRHEDAPLGFERIPFTRGVLSYVKFGGQVAFADDALIESIRLQEQTMRGVERFSRNQRVRITEGPFKHLEGVYLARSGQERVIVLLSLLNQEQRLKIPECDIELVS